MASNTRRTGGGKSSTSGGSQRRSPVSAEGGPRSSVSTASGHGYTTKSVVGGKGKTGTGSKKQTSVVSIDNNLSLRKVGNEENTGGAILSLSTTTTGISGDIHQPQRGIYYANELLHHKDAKAYDREFGFIESVCIIRFPPDIAALLRERLAARQSELSSLLSEGIDEERFSLLRKADEIRNELGLTITPTPSEDYRLFEISVERILGKPSSVVHLTGLLVELPCLLEAYKSLERELLFKANDISQMLYVYDPSNSRSMNIDKLRQTEFWEWQCGLTPGTHRIRPRKFKNFRVFEKGDVAAAEREICDILNSKTVRESVTLEASTEFVMECQLDTLLTRGKLEKNVMSVIGAQNPILRAALQGTSAAEVEGMAEFEQLGQRILRNSIENKEIGLADLSDRIVFSCDSAFQIGETEIIRDDLSDRLFGELDVDESLLVEEDFQLEQNCSMVPLQDGIGKSSPSSVSSEEDSKARRERKHRKKDKTKSNNKHQKPVTPNIL